MVILFNVIFFLLQKPHHMEIEKMTAQWKAEKAFVAQLRLNSEEAQRLVVQTQRCLAGLSTHADAITTQMNNAESALKATEDSLRLFIDLHKKDPILVSLSGDHCIVYTLNAFLINL